MSIFDDGEDVITAIRRKRAEVWKSAEPEEVKSSGIEERARWWREDCPADVIRLLRALANEEWLVKSF
ncbi:hypothetical protein FACS1894211_12840 [Clostridia bacterium]|nr:hypothetical protein FACS1894211_12840 [Clostridia bacterium]